MTSPAAEDRRIARESYRQERQRQKEHEAALRAEFQEIFPSTSGHLGHFWGHSLSQSKE